MTWVCEDEIHELYRQKDFGDLRRPLNSHDIAFRLQHKP